MKFAALGLVICCGMGWAQVPQSRHVWVVTEENHSYEHIVGSIYMPYLNSLLAKGGTARVQR